MQLYNTVSNVHAHAAIIIAAALTLSGANINTTPQYSSSMFDYINPVKNYSKRPDESIFYNSSEALLKYMTIDTYNFSYHDTTEDLDLIDSIQVQPFIIKSTKVKIKVKKIEKGSIYI